MRASIYAAMLVVGLAASAQAASFRVVTLDTGVGLPVEANTPKEAFKEFYRQFGMNVPLANIVTTQTRVCRSTHRATTLATGKLTFGYNVQFPHANCPP